MQDMLPAARLLWKGMLSTLNLEKHWGESCFLLCCVSDGEIWGPSCPSPILRGEGDPIPSLTGGKSVSEPGTAVGLRQRPGLGGCSRPSPAFVCFPAVAPQKCFSQLHPAAVRALRMPHAPGVTVAIESPFHAQEREPSWGSGSFPERLPGAVGWTAGMENRRAHTRKSQRGRRGEIGVT